MKNNRKLLSIEMGRISPEEYKTSPGSGIAVVLDNIRSAHNVGSVFRSADAFKADKIWLCGICAVPPSPEIHKTSLGAEFSVDWEYAGNTSDAVKRLREEGYTILSIEQTVDSTSLDSFIPEPGRKYAVILGNEVDGVNQEIVDISDGVLEIPQSGTKHSLNVSVTAGIVLWHFRLFSAKA
jgi:23S rRNA (guanosine2251-2'-O)-methyltransferase